MKFDADEWIRLIAAVGAVAAMLLGLWLVSDRLKAKNQGFGVNSIRVIGIVLYIPVLLMIPLVVPAFHTETLAALLGTVAGYVLSQSKNADDQ
jgi:hypothetical protein